MNDILLIIILIINSISVLGSFTLLIILLTKKIKEEKNISPPENIMMNVKYSNNLLESTRFIINSIAYIELKTFIDNNELSKVNKAQLADLAKKIAIKARSSIIDNNIKFNHTIFSKEFFNEYIIQFSIDALKQLWEKAIRHKLDNNE